MHIITQLVVNSQPALSQVLVKEENGVKTFYVYGLGLIGQETGGKHTSYHFDLRGSTVALTNFTGQITERFQYSPYGVLLSGNAEKTPFLFNGMYGVMTDVNHLYYMRARFYSPEMRRFVNQDILLGFVEDGQTLNRYAYVTGNPVSYIDPFGLSGEGIEEPGFWESLIPIWGSGKAALFYFQNGQWFWGSVNSGLAISDIFLIKAIAVAFARGICKGGTKAGAGGNWPVIDEVIDPNAVKQANPSMCGPACGEMILKDIGMDILQEHLSKGSTSYELLVKVLSEASGLTFRGGFVGTKAFESFNGLGPWIAMMKEVGPGGERHWVVVDGLDEMGRVMIRDPWKGTKYLMKLDDFFKHWLEIAVFH